MIDADLINKIKADTIREWASNFKCTDNKHFDVIDNANRFANKIEQGDLKETNTVATLEVYKNFHRYKEALMQIRAMKKGSVPERILELVSSTLNQSTK